LKVIVLQLQNEGLGVASFFCHLFSMLGPLNLENNTLQFGQCSPVPFL
jgi:hypothetical protein